MNNTFKHPNPALQKQYDTINSRLQTDEEFLDFAKCLLKLNPDQYNTLYRLVKHTCDGVYIKSPHADDDKKYAVKL